MTSAVKRSKAKKPTFGLVFLCAWKGGPVTPVKGQPPGTPAAEHHSITEWIGIMPAATHIQRKHSRLPDLAVK